MYALVEAILALFVVLFLASGVPLYLKYFNQKKPFSKLNADEMTFAYGSVSMVSLFISAVAGLLAHLAGASVLLRTQIGILTLVFSVFFLFWLARWHAKR